MVKALYVFLVSLQLISYSWARCDLDFVPFKILDGKQEIRELRDLKMGSYNVLNLEYSPGKYLDNPKTGVREFVPQHITKDPEATRKIAEIIKEESLDIVIIQEVEGKKAIELFNKKYLDSEYEPFLIKGNDSRGIEIAFLVKKTMPFKVKFTSSREVKWVNPNTSKEELLLSRDLPALHIWGKSKSAADAPDLVIIGNHLKSQRDRTGDKGSVIMRTQQAEEIANTIKLYDETYPGTPVFVGGDFNANVHEGLEFKPLFKDGLLKDSFDFSPTPLSEKDRITHTFHPRGGETKYSQLDALLVNKHGQELITNAKVYRYKNEQGVEIKIPETYPERELNPSDHFPIIIDLDLSRMPIQ